MEKLDKENEGEKIRKVNFFYIMKNLFKLENIVTFLSKKFI